MQSAICIRCGTQYPASKTPPDHCSICQDEREAVNHDGQQWTTLEEMRGRYRNVITPIDPGVTSIVTEPDFAITQQAHLIQTAAGNVLWDCISYLDEATVREVERLGGLSAIGISHPHFYGSMVEWSHAFDAPIHLHSDNRTWVMRPDSAIRYWDGESVEVLPGITLVRCGGHFPGSTVLHWADGAEGSGALFTCDTIAVVDDRRWVSFMYSYVNHIPLGADEVRRIVGAVDPYPFDRIYGGWKGLVISSDAKRAVERSAERYIRHIRG